MPIKLSAITAATSIAASDLLYAVIGGNSRRITAANLFGTYPGSLVKPQTAQVASGNTVFDFTGIPAWVQRITVAGFGLRTNGTSVYTLRVGDGAIVASGYFGAVTTTAGATPTTNNPATGATLLLSPTVDSVFRFKATIDRVSGNTWVISGSGSLSNTNTTSAFCSEITLTGDLDRVRLTTAPAGTDTFTAGTVNIAWE
jgi:hypothetical protein